MDILLEFERLHKEICAQQEILDKLISDRINWCRKNKDEIKSILPDSNKMYQIKSIPDYYLKYHYEHFSDGVYFFKPTKTRFVPSLIFDRSWRNDIYPTVKGDVYDINLNKIDFYNFEICITQLTEITKESEYFKNKITCVYIMIDKNTGYYKIGRSKNPKARERTLQSEKPTIEIIFSSEAKVKDEKTLHDMFNHKRVRGEWFDLNGSDILKIKDYFCTTSPPTYTPVSIIH